VLIFTLRRTESGVRVPGYKHLTAMAAQAQRLCLVGQSEAEHHLDAQQQGMEVPNDRRLVQQGYAIGRRGPAESRHAGTV